MPVLAASQLPAADAAPILLPQGDAQLVKAIALLAVLSLFNNVLRMAPRILFGIGRDGLLTVKAALGSDSGTPLTAVAITSAIIIIVILTGTFEQIIR